MTVGHHNAASFLYIASLFLFVTLFGPYAIYGANQGEFQSTFAALVPSLLNWQVGFVLLAIGALLLLVPNRISGYVASVILALMAFLVVEFIFLVGDTQVIGNVETGVAAEYGGVGLRIGILAAAFVAALLLRQRLHRFAIALVVIFAALQILQIGVALAGAGIFAADEPSTGKGAAGDFFKFSDDENIIHIVLDEYQYSFFEEISETRFPEYKDKLSGFTYFRNNAGLYPNTHHSMYALYRNKPYRNDIPSKDWIRASGDDSILNQLVEKGVGVELMAQLKYNAFRGKAGMTVQEIPSPYIGLDVRVADTQQTEAQLLRQLTIQRMVPQFLHATLKVQDEESAMPGSEGAGDDDSAPRSAGAQAQYLMDRAQAGALFLEDLGRKVRAGGNGVSYKMIHILTTHNPAALDEECNQRDRIRTPDWEAMTPQTICVQRHLFRFLDRLKELGLYNKSTIIIHADHGKRMAPLADNHLEKFVFGEVQNPQEYTFHFSQVMSSAMPLLLVKPKGAQGPFTVSNAPVSSADIPPTILGAANVALEDGERTVFDIEEDEKRTRPFFYYHYPEGQEPYIDRMIEYNIDGPVWRPESWTQAEVYIGPHSDFTAGTIDVGSAKDRHYLRDWWRVAVDRTADSRTIAYSMGSMAEIGAKFPDRDDRVMTVTMRAMEENQVVDVTLNGNTVGAISIPAAEKGYAEYSVDIPARLMTADADEINVIGFSPRTLTNTWPDPKADRMQYGVAVDMIDFAKK